MKINPRRKNPTRGLAMDHDMGHRGSATEIMEMKRERTKRDRLKLRHELDRELED